MPDHVKAALQKIREDLAWRGPSGKTLAYAVIPRDQAEALIQHIDTALLNSGHCPICLGSVITGYGMAGGGMGVYLFCDDCQQVVTKFPDADDNRDPPRP